MKTTISRVWDIPVPQLILLPLCYILIAQLQSVTAHGTSCPTGRLYFHVQNSSHGSIHREYFFHTSAETIAECVEKCYGNQYCQSVGFTPRKDDKPACLFSYRSGIPCRRWKLVNQWSRADEEVVADCMRCNPSGSEASRTVSGGSGGDASTATTNEVIGVRTNNSIHATGSAGASSHVNSSTIANLIAAVEDSLSATATDTAPRPSTFSQNHIRGGSSGEGVEVNQAGSIGTPSVVRHFDTTVVSSGSSATDRNQIVEPRGCTGVISFEVVPMESLDSEKKTLYGFEKQVEMDSASQCARECYLDNRCRYAGYIPLPGGTPSGKEGVCFYAYKDYTFHHQCSGNSVSGVQTAAGVVLLCLRCVLASTAEVGSVQLVGTTGTGHSSGSVIPGISSVPLSGSVGTAHSSVASSESSASSVHRFVSENAASSSGGQASVVNIVPVNADETFWFCGQNVCRGCVYQSCPQSLPLFGSRHRCQRNCGQAPGTETSVQVHPFLVTARTPLEAPATAAPVTLRTIIRITEGESETGGSQREVAIGHSPEERLIKTCYVFDESANECGRTAGAICNPPIGSRVFAYKTLSDCQILEASRRRSSVGTGSSTGGVLVSGSSSGSIAAGTSTHPVLVTRVSSATQTNQGSTTSSTSSLGHRTDPLIIDKVSTSAGGASVDQAFTGSSSTDQVSAGTSGFSTKEISTGSPSTSQLSTSTSAKPTAQTPTGSSSTSQVPTGTSGSSTAKTSTDSSSARQQSSFGGTSSIGRQQSTGSRIISEISFISGGSSSGQASTGSRTISHASAVGHGSSFGKASSSLQSSSHISAVSGSSSSGQVASTGSSSVSQVSSGTAGLPTAQTPSGSHTITQGTSSTSTAALQKDGCFVLDPTAEHCFPITGPACQRDGLSAVSTYRTESDCMYAGSVLRKLVCFIFDVRKKSCYRTTGFACQERNTERIKIFKSAEDCERSLRVNLISFTRFGGQILFTVSSYDINTLSSQTHSTSTAASASECAFRCRVSTSCLVAVIRKDNNGELACSFLTEADSSKLNDCKSPLTTSHIVSEPVVLGCLTFGKSMVVSSSSVALPPEVKKTCYTFDVQASTCISATGTECEPGGNTKAFRTMNECSLAHSLTTVVELKTCYTYDTASQQCFSVDGLACSPPPGAAIKVFESEAACRGVIVSVNQTTTGTSTTCQPADFIFVLDSSGSISSSYYAQLAWVMDAVEQLTISPDYHRVALLSYGGRTRKIEVGFDDFNDRNKLLNNISTLPFYRGTTDTGAALKLAKTYLEQNRRPGVRAFVVVVTAGLTQDDTEEPVNAISSTSNVDLYAVGITETLNQAELLKIGGGRQSHTIIRKSAKALIKQIKEFVSCDNVVIKGSEGDISKTGGSTTQSSATRFVVIEKGNIVGPPAFYCSSLMDCIRCVPYITCPLDQPIYDTSDGCSALCDAKKKVSIPDEAIAASPAPEVGLSAISAWQCDDTGACSTCDPLSTCKLDRPIYDMEPSCKSACQSDGGFADGAPVATQVTEAEAEVKVAGGETNEQCWTYNGETCMLVAGEACNPPPNSNITTFTDETECKNAFGGAAEQCWTHNFEVCILVTDDACNPPTNSNITIFKEETTCKSFIAEGIEHCWTHDGTTCILVRGEACTPPPNSNITTFVAAEDCENAVGRALGSSSVSSQTGLAGSAIVSGSSQSNFQSGGALSSSSSNFGQSAVGGARSFSSSGQSAAGGAHSSSSLGQSAAGGVQSFSSFGQSASGGAQSSSSFGQSAAGGARSFSSSGQSAAGGAHSSSSLGQSAAGGVQSFSSSGQSAAAGAHSSSSLGQSAAGGAHSSSSSGQSAAGGVQSSSFGQSAGSANSQRGSFGQTGALATRQATAKSCSTSPTFISAGEQTAIFNRVSPTLTSVMSLPECLRTCLQSPACTSAGHMQPGPNNQPLCFLTEFDCHSGEGAHTSIGSIQTAATFSCISCASSGRK